MNKPRKRRGSDRLASAYLKRLGDRVRALRARRGVTRRTLVVDSGVSERFLAALEGGLGNPSILVLRQIAEALGVSLADLVNEQETRSVDHLLITQTLDRLTNDELAEARALLSDRFPRALSSRENYIALIGLRGAGKTTLGKLLASTLKVPFIELDRLVEQEYGATIGEILALHGQAGYLRQERHCLEMALMQHKGAVIEIGGGLATDPETLDRLLEATRTVWIRALPEEHMQRVIEQGDLRPMASNRGAMEDLRAILKAREPFYGKASQTVNTSGKSPPQSLRELLKVLR
jgi:XRE family aerobic/anaerobic benzoate catabolism transcriptional regulator